MTLQTDKLTFINTTFPHLLLNLSPETPHKWGLMNPQQMVEHLTGYVRIASGKNPVRVVTLEEHIPAFRRFLESDKEFRENTKNPLNNGDPDPVRLSSLEEAVEEYNSALNEFNSIFEKEPGKTTAHPAFGYLGYGDWIKLHYKHLRHHARQFGLID